MSPIQVNRVEMAVDRVGRANKQYELACPDRGDPITKAQIDAVQNLGFALLDLGTIFVEEHHIAASRTLEEAWFYLEKINAREALADVAYMTSRAFIEIAPPLPDNWDVADRWANRSIELRSTEDAKGRARSRAQLGLVWLARGRSRKPGDAQQREEAGRAVAELSAARTVLPNGTSRAGVENNLAFALSLRGDDAGALTCYASSIRGYELAGEHELAASARLNAAMILIKLGRFDETRDYLRSARLAFSKAQNHEKVAEVDQIESLVGKFERRWPASQRVKKSSRNSRDLPF